MEGRLGRTARTARTLAARWGWAALAPAVAAFAVRGALDATRVVFLRDLSAYFWPEHVWLREALRSGRLPLWDPYVGFGQSAIADPVRHILFPPTLLLRAALPDVLGFNLVAALPFPVAALGAYAFLARRASPPAAALGAIVFSVCGPALSTGNLVNVSWAMACIPWVLLSVERLVERPSARRAAPLAVAFALQFLAGEGVTLVATAVLAVAYAAAGIAWEGWRAAAARVGGVTAAGLGGLLLSAPVALPMASALAGSLRGIDPDPRVTLAWSVHPLTLLETVAPHLFSDPVAFDGGNWPWLSALNGGFSPFFYSVYMSAGALAIASVGALCSRDRRASVFWAVVACVAVLLAVGPHTAFYPALQAVVPPVRSLRFPTKYLLFAALAAAQLVALGWDALAARPEIRASVRFRAVAIAAALLAVAAVATTALALALPGTATGALTRLAAAAGVTPADAGGRFLASSLLGAGPRLFALAAATGVCLWWGASAGREGRVARWALFAMIAADLAITGSGLTPTIEARLLREPAWAAQTRGAPDARVYVAGRVSATVDRRRDPDDPVAGPERPVSGRSVAADLAVRSAFLATFPSAWRLRDSLSFDNTFLWPSEYDMALRRFRVAGFDERIRFLRRAGVRYYLVPWREWEAGRAVAGYEEPARLTFYEGPDPLPRVSLAAGALVVPDRGEQIERLFASDPVAEPPVLLDAPPPEPAGAAGPGAGAAVRVVSESAEEMVVEARVPSTGGYLVVRDTFSPAWHVEVDGASAELLRADALFRAVRVAPGDHVVRFFHRDRFFRAGLLVALVAALALVAACLFARRD